MHRFTSLSDRPARFEAAGLVALCAAVAVLAWWLLAPEAVMLLMDESGPIEETTAVLYFLVAAYVLVAGVPQAEPSLPLPLCVVLCGFGARELDLHKAFTETSVLKVSFYLGDAPLAHKLVAAVVVLAVLAALLHLLVRHGRTVWRGLRQGHPAAVTVAVFAVAMVAAKVIDRSRMVLLEDFGVAIGTSATALFIALEETLEFGLPLIVLLGLLRHRRPAPAPVALSARQTP